MMAEIIIGQARILVGFADIDRDPFAVCEKLGPAMVPINSPVISLGGDACTDGEPGRDAHLPCQGDEIRMKIGTIAGAGITGVNSVADAPAGAIFGIAQFLDYVIVKRAGTGHVGRFSTCDLRSEEHTS